MSSSIPDCRPARPAILSGPLYSAPNVRRRAGFIMPAVALIAGVTLFAGHSARAANVTHVLSGTSSNVSTATFTPALPSGGVIGDLIQYNTATTAYVLTLDVNTTIGGVKQTNSGPLTITGGVLTLDGTGISGTTGTGNIFGNAGVAFLGLAGTTGNFTVNSAISLATDADFGSTTNGSTLTIGGAVTNDSGTAKNLNFRANSTTTIADTAAIGATGSNIAISNLGTSTGGVTLSGNLGPSVTTVTQNSATSALTLSGLNTYTGGTTLTAGTLTASNVAATNQFLALGTGTLTLNGGTLQLRADGSGTTGIITGNGTTGNNVVVGGNATINTNTAGGTAVASAFVFNNLTIGANTLIVTPASNSYGVRFAGTTTLTGTPTFNVQGGLTTTLVGVVGESGGSFGLTKTGSSTLSLQGANTYTGATTISAGTISLNGANGSILTTSGITVSGTSARLFLDNSGSNNNNRIAGNVNLSLGGELSLQGSSGADTLEAFGTLGLGAGATTVTVTQTTAGRLSTLSATSLSRTGNGTTLVRGSSLGGGSQAGKITLGTPPSGASFVGTGGAPAGTGTTKNLAIVPWMLGTTSASNTAGTDFVTYDTTAASLRTLATAEYDATTLTLATAGNNVKDSTATETGIASKTVNSLILVPGAAQTITGAGGGSNVLTISSGALASALASGAIGTAAFNSTFSGFDTIAFGNDEAVVTVAQTGGTITLNSPVTVTNNGGLTKAGAGTLAISNTNLAGVTGALNINAGTLALGTLASNATVANNIAGNGGLLTFTPAGTNTFSGNLSGPTLAVTQATAGTTVVLSGANTNAGATNITAGTLQALANAGNTTGGVSTALSANSAISLGVGATLQLRGDSDTTFSSGAGVTNGVGGLLVSGIGTAVIDVNQATAAGSNRVLSLGNVVFNSGATTTTPTVLSATGGNGYTLGLGAVNASNTTNQAQAFTFDANTANIIAASFTGSTGNATALSFTGASNTTITGAIAQGTTRGVPIVMNQTGSVILNGNNTNGTSFALNSGTAVVNNGSGLNGTPTLGNTTAGSTAAVNLLLGGTNATGTVAGTNGGITVANAISVRDTTSGQLTIGGQNTSNTNTYSGIITLGATANTGKSANLVAAGGGTVAFTNTIVRNGTDATAGVTINNPYVVNGATVTPTGIVTLSGANTYGGGTAINGGTLLANYNTVSATASSTGTGPVTVGSGMLTGVLGGTGRVLGAVTVNGGSTLLGGVGSTAAGALTLSVNPTLNPNSIIELALGATGTHSTINLATGGFNGFNSNQAFTLDGVQAGNYDNIITGIAANIVTTGFTVTNGSGYTFSFTDDGTNLDLSVTAVPEPSTWVAGVLGLGVLGLRLRRRLAGAFKRQSAV